jgi:hypothetical protein
MYDVCVLHEDEYVTLIANNETIDHAITAFIKECVKRCPNTRDLLTKAMFNVISHDNIQMATMLWAKNEINKNPVLIVLREDRNISYIFDVQGNLVNKKPFIQGK